MDDAETMRAKEISVLGQKSLERRSGPGASNRFRHACLVAVSDVTAKKTLRRPLALRQQNLRPPRSKRLLFHGATAERMTLLVTLPIAFAIGFSPTATPRSPPPALARSTVPSIAATPPIPAPLPVGLVLSPAIGCWAGAQVAHISVSKHTQRVTKAKAV